MSKAILVINMPSCCDECDIKGIFCGDVGDNDMCRAGGCPLKEVPKKKKDTLMTNYSRYVQGWNDCMDRILEGSEENG